jgi:gliding motility-associated-like protein
MVKMRNLCFYFLCLVLFAANASGQAILTMDSKEAEEGERVEIDFVLSGVQLISSIQFRSTWNPDILQFVEMKNLSTRPGFEITLDDFNIDPSQVDNGFFLFIRPFFLAPGPVNGSVHMFTAVFDVIGSVGDCSPVTIADQGQPKLEIADQNFNILDVTVNGGEVCVIENLPGGILTAPALNLPVGVTGCGPVRISEFQNVTSFQFSMNWNPAVATFSSVTQLNTALPGFSVANHFTINASAGTLTVQYSSPNPISLPPNSKLFDICFTGAPVEGFSTLGFGAPFSFTTVGGEILPVTASPGTITVFDPDICELDGLGFDIGSVSGSVGEIVCVPVKVLNFNNIVAFNGVFFFDQTKLRFNNVQINQTGLQGFTANDFFNVPGAGRLRMSWVDGAADCRTLADGTTIFNICFEILMEEGCQEITLGSDGTLGVSALQCAGASGFAEIDLEHCSGLVCTAVIPDLEIVLDAALNPCAGEQNGRILVTVQGGVPPYSYEWVNVLFPGMVLSTNEDLINLGPGTYRLTVTDNAGSEVSQIFSVFNDPLRLSGLVVSPADEGDNGAISFSIEGGSPPYQVTWRKEGQFFSNDVNLANLTPGNYTLEIVDANGCILTREFNINEGEIEIDAVLIRPSCHGLSDGSINIMVLGGGSFTFVWSNGATSSSLTGLVAGNYSVTITDTQSGRMGEFSFQLTQPDVLTISSFTVIEVGDLGNDGAINITPGGGTPPYAFLWSNGSTSQNITGLSEGVYSLTLSDANGCTFVFGPVIVSSENELVVDVEVLSVRCFGEDNGEIRVTPLTGIPPYTYLWSHNANLAGPIADNLSPGFYTVRVEDSSGKIFEEEFEILEPARLMVAMEANPSTNPNQFNGTALATASGGTLPYSFRWDDRTPGSTASFITGLRPGTYRVLVTDAQGCQVIGTTDVLSGRIDCFSSRPIITPNGDGRNDNLVIACSQRYENTLIIFDKHGQKVFETKNYADNWEGQGLDGSPVPDGTYFFVFLVKDQGNQNESVHKGSVTVIRTFN